MHPIVHVLPAVAIAVGEGEHPSSVSFALVEVADVRGPVPGPLPTHPVPQALLPMALVAVSVVVLANAPALAQTLHKVARVRRPARQLLHSVAVVGAPLPLALVPTPARKAIHACAGHLSVHELALVAVLRVEDVHPEPGPPAVRVLAGEGVPVGQRDEAPLQALPLRRLGGGVGGEAARALLGERGGRQPASLGRHAAEGQGGGIRRNVPNTLGATPALDPLPARAGGRGQRPRACGNERAGDCTRGGLRRARLGAGRPVGEGVRGGEEPPRRR
mmetsp:Transcript_465/g.965  ORF Transcript_465/g.965 Transcript_465/m.965 type:complete len:275 (+) Transcript_465:827-1651(+)